MKKLAIISVVLASLLGLLAVAALWLWEKDAADFEDAVALERPPSIRPDYAATVIPPNIAPLNFLVDEPGDRFRARIHSTNGKTIEIVSRSSQIRIPASQWRQLLSENRGEKLYFDVCVRREDGRWTRFAPVENTIADAKIDRYLFYRIIRPIFILRTDVAIYQRDIESYEESVVVSNQSFEGGCINCHTFAPNHADTMVLHSRGTKDSPNLSGMIVVQGGEVRKVDTRALIRAPEHDRGFIKQSLGAFTSWHPSGRVAAFSVNDVLQLFHAVGENRDGFDAASDLALYHVDSNTVTTTPQISQDDRLETFPTWSPDGRYLYFCSAPSLPKERYLEVRYDLMRISYDPNTGDWGEIEPVLLAEDTGLSITEPRVSPDGRWLLFCMANYSAFAVFRPSSDLYLMDLENGEYRALEVNSPRSESWHSWSQNSRWIAFATKRRDGLFTQVYLSHVDQDGHAHKPILLPQEDPTFYDRFLKIYNIPELAPWPAPASSRTLVQAIHAPVSADKAMPTAAGGMQGPDMEVPDEIHP